MTSRRVFGSNLTSTRIHNKLALIDGKESYSHFAVKLRFKGVDLQSSRYALDSRVEVGKEQENCVDRVVDVGESGSMKMQY